jgi:enoyl-CoA hydratase/carnithine racemase
MGGTVLVERDGGVTTITLNRPDRLNSFTAEMHGELAEAFANVESDEACRARRNAISARAWSSATTRWCAACARCRSRS